MGEEPGRSRGALSTTLATAAVLAGHLALVAYFAPRRAMVSGTPLLTDAFAVEVYRVLRMHTGALLHGRPFVYDPQVLAGQMAGLVERFGTRVFLLGVPFLERFGLSPGRGFNALVLAHHALVPLLGYGAARAFGLRRHAAVITMALWSAVWFFDSLLHVAWYSGRAPFALASAVIVLASGLAHRARHGPVGNALGVLFALSFATLLHPVVAVYGIALGLSFTALSRGNQSGRRLGIFSAHLVPLLLCWLPARGLGGAFSEPMASSFHAGLSQIFWDGIDVAGPGHHAAGASRTLFRVVCLVAGALGLVRWREQGDGRFVPLSGLTAVGLVLGYAGGYVPLVWPVDPHYFVVSAVLAAAIPASVVLSELSPGRLFRDGPQSLRVLLGLAVLVIVPRAYRTVATYVPELLPERVIRSDADLHVSALVGLNEPLPAPLRHDILPFRYHDLRAWLVERAAGRGRVLVDDAALAGLLAITTSLPVLGPLGERGSDTGDADPSALLAGSGGGDAVHAYLTRYAVGWVVLAGRLGVLDREDPFLDAPVDVYGFRVRRVLPEPSFFAEGHGTLGDVQGGRLPVTDASGPVVTLRFHYHPRLACRPGCTVESHAVFGDRAGFVSVRSPPPAFEVYLP